MTVHMVRLEPDSSGAEAPLYLSLFVVELEAAAEEVAAAELAELVAAAQLRVAAEAEVPEAVADEGGSARARRRTRRRARERPERPCTSGRMTNSHIIN